VGYSSRKPYYNLNDSMVTFFRKPSRFLKDSARKESVMEKPYFSPEYAQMHLDLNSPKRYSYTMPEFPEFPPLPEFPEKPKGSDPYDKPDFPDMPEFPEPPEYDFPDMPPSPDPSPFPDFPTIPGTPVYDVVGWSEYKSLGGCSTWTFDGKIECGESAKIDFSTDIIGGYSTGEHFNWEFTVYTQSSTTLTFVNNSLFGTWDRVRVTLEVADAENGGVSETIVVCGKATWMGYAVITLLDVWQTYPGEPPTLFDSTYKTYGFGILQTMCCEEIEIECDTCEEDPSMAWDTDTSAETVARNASVTVAVIGINTSFTWSVSGTGFTLDNETTTGLTNTLNADDTACGSATITVTGCDDTSVTGYVRCTTGAWGDWVVLCDAGVGCFPNKVCDVIEGNRNNYSCWDCVPVDQNCGCDGLQTCEPPVYGSGCDYTCLCSCGPPSGKVGIGVAKYRLWGC